MNFCMCSYLQNHNPNNPSAASQNRKYVPLFTVMVMKLILNNVYTKCAVSMKYTN